MYSNKNKRNYNFPYSSLHATRNHVARSLHSRLAPHTHSKAKPLQLHSSHVPILRVLAPYRWLYKTDVRLVRRHNFSREPSEENANRFLSLGGEREKGGKQYRRRIKQVRKNDREWGRGEKGMERGFHESQTSDAR